MDKWINALAEGWLDLWKSDWIGGRIERGRWIDG